MRTKTLFVSVLMLAALVLSACAPAVVTSSAQAPQRVLSVTGVGQVDLAPDIAYITVGVHTENASAADAVSENNTRTQAVVDALKKAGVAEKDIRTTNFSIWMQDKTDPITGQSTGEKVYVVDNSVNVTVRKLASLGDMLDTLVKTGANNISSIQFDVADKTAAVKQARDAAVQDAKAQAEELAAAAGVTLGDITSISFYDNVPGPVYQAYGKGGGGFAAADIAVPIQPGQMTVSVSVSMTYEIK
jgi:hypothetical protein